MTGQIFGLENIRKSSWWKKNNLPILPVIFFLCHPTLFEQNPPPPPPFPLPFLNFISKYFILLVIYNFFFFWGGDVLLLMWFCNLCCWSPCEVVDYIQGTVEGLYCKRPIQCLASSVDPPATHPPGECVPPPPPLVRGEDTLAGWRVGGSIVWKTPDTALYSIYVSTLYRGHSPHILPAGCRISTMQFKNVQIDTQVVLLKGHTLERDKENNCKQNKMQNKNPIKKFYFKIQFLKLNTKLGWPVLA